MLFPESKQNLIPNCGENRILSSPTWTSVPLTHPFSLLTGRSILHANEPHAADDHRSAPTNLFVGSLPLADMGRALCLARKGWPLWFSLGDATLSSQRATHIFLPGAPSLLHAHGSS